jgi:DNA-binding response OmpR family regulator
VADLLLCEDDDDVAMLLEIVLARAGHSVARYGTVGGALAALAADEFDLVVTDLGLPDASGADVCHAGEAHGVPVIVVTARQADEELAEVRGCARSVLSKPIDFGLLHDAISAAL